MIPRYQRILFWILAGAILLMALFMLHGCEQAREKLTRHRNETPLAAPVATPARPSISPWPTTPTAPSHGRPRDRPARRAHRPRPRAARRASSPNTPTRTPPTRSRAAPPSTTCSCSICRCDRRRLPARAQSRRSNAAANRRISLAAPHVPGGQLAVINLHGTFADHHPSGIEAETLTIDSIIGTLYANFPRIEQVRFLVDGQPRDTLAGHADLLRTYPGRRTPQPDTAQETR